MPSITRGSPLFIVVEEIVRINLGKETPSLIKLNLKECAT